MHLFEQKGISLLEDLEGMYAFAIVDTRKEQLFSSPRPLWREATLFGPHQRPKGVALASELKALLPLENVE